MNTELTVSGLSFAYGEQEVLCNIDFTLGGGCFCCLLGRNGAGKSTLMRCLLGISGGYTGSIAVNGREQRSYTPPQLARSIAYIPQSVDSVYEYSVEQFVLMGRAAHLGIFSAPAAADKAIAREAMETLGIGALSHKSFSEISGGERQLATIARALTQQSRILIMDEPTASLDYGNQVRFMKLARQLAEQGYLVLMSCHNPHQAGRYAHQVMVLHQGGIHSMGVARDIVTPQMVAQVYGVEEDCGD